MRQVQGSDDGVPDQAGRGFAGSILVWRSNELDYAPYAMFDLRNCPCCGVELLQRQWFSPPPSSIPWHGSLCPLCGWWARLNHVGNWNEDPFCYSAILREFNVSDASVGIEELGSYLRHDFDSIYDLSWARFEQLIGDVFKNLGYRVAMTRLTRDNGADVLLYDDRGRIEAIVECKRYRETRKVGIGAVHRLAGAALDWNVGRALIVASSTLTSDAKRAAAQISNKSHIELEFVEASELLSLLGVYRTPLPTLVNLDEPTRHQLIRNNTATMDVERILRHL